MRSIHLNIGSTDTVAIYTFGNGVIRGVAACLTWMLLIVVHKKTQGKLNWTDDHVKSLVKSLWNITCTYEKHGDGSDRACIVAQMARQNQNAEVQPVNSLQWIQLVIAQMGFNSIGDINSISRRELMDCLNKLASDYDCHPDVMAYDEAPKRKPDTEPDSKRRKKAGQRDADNAEREAESFNTAGGIRMGNRKLSAIKSFLHAGTDEALQMLIGHVHRVEWRYCCLNDDILSLSWLYLNSTIPSSLMPEMEPRSAGLVSAPPGLTVQAVSYNTPLSKEEVSLIWLKAMALFYDRTTHLEQAANRARHRSGVEDFKRIRLMIQFWCQVMRPVCRADMAAEQDDFDDHEQTIIFGTAFDCEISSLIERMISHFHLAMLSNHAERLVAETSVQASLIQNSVLKQIRVNLELFKLRLEQDWKTIRELSLGRSALIDLLVWVKARHLAQQANLAKDHTSLEVNTIKPETTLNNVLEGAHRPVHAGSISFLLLCNRH